MAFTTNYSWNLPTVGGSTDAWGDLLNANWTAIDTLLGGTNATEFAILDGATVTTAELNILDGVTATTAEINVLDGITATVTELNYTDGVTSNIQTQLDGKQSLDATLTAYAGTLTAANKIPYATATDTAGELDFKDEDDMASNSATAVPSQQSVKAYVDANVSNPLTDMVDYTAGYQNLSLTSGTAYQNTKSTWVIVYYMLDYNVGMKGEVSANGTTWFTIHGSFGTDAGYTLMVPPGHYYRLTSSSGFHFVVQLG